MSPTDNDATPAHPALQWRHTADPATVLALVALTAILEFVVGLALHTWLITTLAGLSRWAGAAAWAVPTAVALVWLVPDRPGTRAHLQRTPAPSDDHSIAETWGVYAMLRVMLGRRRRPVVLRLLLALALGGPAVVGLVVAGLLSLASAFSF